MNNRLPDVYQLWSVALPDVLGTDEAGLCWLAAMIEELVSTGAGSAEVWVAGPAAFHFLVVPTRYSRSGDEELLVVEITGTARLVQVNVRPAFVGTEPCMDHLALFEVRS